MKPIEIFSAGKHTDKNGQVVSMTTDDLQNIADNYNPEFHEAPIVIGHPKDNGPAYGWVKSLSVVDDKLVAEPHELDANFSELVKEGKYKKVSASFYTPNAPSNPVSGVFSLRHVGFLGAHAPAVKGLKGVEFSSDDEGVVDFGDYGDRAVSRILRNIKNYFIGSIGQDEAEKLVPEWDLEAVHESALTPEDAQASFSEEAKEVKKEPGMDKKQESNVPSDAQIKEAETKLQADRDAFEKERAEFAEQQATVRKEENKNFVNSLVSEGKLTPASATGLNEFMDTLDTAATVEFGEGDEKGSQTSLAFFKDFLNGLPKAVEFGEVAKDDKDVVGSTVNFTAPEGYTVDEGRMELMNKAESYAKEHGISFDEAVTKLEGK